MTADSLVRKKGPKDRRKKPRTNPRDVVMSWSMPVLGVIGTIVLWWAATAVFAIDPFLVPSPGDVLASFTTQPGYLMEQFWVTLLETIQGFALAVLIGVPIAVVIAMSKLVEQIVYPLLLIVNSVPKVAIAPILVVWMGFGQMPKIVMVFLLCFFPIVISTATGLKNTPTELVDLVKSLGSSHLQAFFKVRFPNAMPHVMVGLKTAISLAVIGAVIAEFVGADAGLGFVIVQSGASADTALAFASMALLGLMSVVLFYVLSALEKVLLPWAEDNR